MDDLHKSIAYLKKKAKEKKFDILIALWLAEFYPVYGGYCRPLQRREQAMCYHSTLRPLTDVELDMVSGGDYIDNNHDGVFNDGDDWLVQAGGGGAGNSAYWAIGGALGIGFGLWGTSESWGITWTAGIGAYVVTGMADSADQALQEVGQDDFVIGAEVNGAPTVLHFDPTTGGIRLDGFGFTGGVIAIEPQGAGGSQDPGHYPPMPNSIQADFIQAEL